MQNDTQRNINHGISVISQEMVVLLTNFELYILGGRLVGVKTIGEALSGLLKGGCGRLIEVALIKGFIFSIILRIISEL